MSLSQEARGRASVLGASPKLSEVPKPRSRLPCCPSALGLPPALWEQTGVQEAAGALGLAYGSRRLRLEKA